VDLCFTVIQSLLLVLRDLSIQLALNSLFLHEFHAFLQSSALVGLFRSEVLGQDFPVLSLL
jgi:hypothetical protein